MTQQSIANQEMRQQEWLVKAVARELGVTAAQTGGKIERKEEHLVAELYYQSNIIWVLEFPVKIIILVKGDDEWEGFYALWSEGYEALHAVHYLDPNDVIWDLRPVDPEGRAILPPLVLGKDELQNLLNNLRQEGFTI